jgi:hypothetical protein
VRVSWWVYGLWPYTPLSVSISVNPLVEEVVDSSSRYASLLDANCGHEYVQVSEIVVPFTVGVCSTGPAGSVTVNVTATSWGLFDAVPDVTETVAAYVPALSDPVMGWTVSVAGAVVLFSETCSQPDPVPYETEAPRPVSVPPPALVTLTVLDAGFPKPLTALKLKLVGESAMAGGGPTAATVHVTLTVWGLFAATPDVTDTVAVCVPAGSDPVISWAVSVEGAVVLLRVTWSHPDPLL